MFTQEQYFEAAAKHGQPGEDGQKTFPVINSRDHNALWLMWMVYFTEIGMHASVYEMAKAWGTGTTWTVPVLDPTRFDPGFVVYADRMEAMRRHLEAMDGNTEDERKAVVKAALKSFRASKLQQPVTREAAE